jgi:predicted Zn-ribbon and HTH transcriptional regulator
MADEEKNLEEWIEEERARLDKGFTYEPKPSSQAGKPSSADQVMAGLGLGAGVLAGAVAPHPESVTFQGCKANVIATALRREIANDDTHVQVDRSGDSVVVTISQSQASRPHRFSPALTATLIETPDMLTVTVSDLSGEAKRSTLGSVGRTVLNQGKRMLFRRRGIMGLFRTAGDVMEGVEDLVEDIQDLGLPKRVWEVIDRVGEAAEKAYLDEKRKQQEVQRQREAVERAWTHCESCGRAYREDEADRVDCPSCGGVRGEKPGWLT